MDKKTLLLYISTIFLSLRKVIFEAYHSIAFVMVLSVLLFIIAVICSNWVLMVLFAVLSWFIAKKMSTFVLPYRYLFIRRGDEIECVLPDESTLEQTFIRAKVVAKVRKEQVDSSEYADYLESPIFLVTYQNKREYISAAWIVSIEIE